MTYRSHLLILLTLLTQFAFASVRIAGADSIKIGLLLCQTGSCAEWGSAAIEGAQLAVEEVNARGGVAGKSIELVVEDSAEDTPSRTLTGYRSLRSRGIELIVGPTWSAAANALAPIAKSDPSVIMLSPSVGMRDFNEAGDNLFNIWPHDEYSARKLAQFAREQGLLRIALFGAQQPWSETQARVFREEFEDRGGIITTEVSPTPDVRDLRTEAGKVARSGAQAVVFTCFSEQMGVAAAQLNQLGFQGQKLSVLMYETAIGSARGTLEGALYTSFAEPSPSFRSAFVARYGRSPGSSADKGYDAIRLLARAREQAASPAISEVKRALASTKDFSGASGAISFNSDRAVLRYPEVFEVRSGKMGLAYQAEPGKLGRSPVLALKK